jgi:glucose/arabinose dehydrogenase
MFRSLAVPFLLLLAAAAPAPRVETVATGLDHPWSIAFLPDGRVLVTERPGRLRIIDHGKLDPQPVSGLPQVYTEGQSGLFDVVLDPDFATTGRLFIAFAGGTTAGSDTEIASARLDGRRLTDFKVLYKTHPLRASALQFGGRIAFLPDKTLLLTIGEGAKYNKRAQDLDSDLGKVLRLDRDGKAPADNPFVGKAGVRPEIYTLGHRNPQGLVYDPVRHAVYASEHGPKGGDEINILKPGANYGWPKATYGANYDGTPVSPDKTLPGMENGIVVWVPSIAPSGLAVYRGRMFPEWQGELLSGALAGTQLRRVHLDAAGKVVGQQVLLKDLGERIRDVRVAPDGSVWLATDSEDGKILRLSR